MTLAINHQGTKVISSQGMALDNRPLFEIVLHNGHVCKIWTDGRIEGFTEGAIVISRVQQLVAETVNRDRAIRTAE